MSVLQKIVEKKKDRLSAAKYATSLSELKSLIKDLKRPRDFGNAVKRGKTDIRLIAEIKKASPSKGLIRTDFDPASIAAVYERGPVDAISVITEEDFFQGSLRFLKEVKRVTSKPVLRKDFIFDEYQIYEARSQGADALLLIAAILERSQAEEYQLLAMELGMSVLFEVHDGKELEMALRIDAPIIGINNRDLKTLKIDLNTSLLLRRDIPPELTVVSESGIRTRDDVVRIASAGIDAMLVGTLFMESPDITLKLWELAGRGLAG